MNRGEGQQGYTIVETLIFLAVSALMFIIAVGQIGGRQNRVMFQNATRDLETKLTDIANDVTTGYYVDPGNLRCQKSATGPDFTNNVPGDCVFVGTVVKFGADDGGSVSQERFMQITMAGLRQAASTNENAKNLGQSMPKGISTNVAAGVLQYGAKVECIGVGLSCTPGVNNAALGFFTSFQTNLSGDLQSGGLKTDLLLYPSVGLTDNQTATLSKIAHGTTGTTTNYATVVTNPAVYNPPTGITVCLSSGSTAQYALIRIGSSNASKMTVTSEIKDIIGGNLCS